MKSAFTMIELIFVIVIIGILVSIAAIKLGATRDDAKLIQTVSNIKVATTDIVSYAFAKNSLSNNILDMSNALKIMVNQNQAFLENNSSIKIKMGNINDCLTYKIVKNTINSTIVINKGNANGDSRCLSLQNKINISDYPVRIRGQLIIND